MALNVTSEMTPEQVLIQSHQGTAVPSMLILFGAMMFIFLVFGNYIRSKGVKSYNTIILICFLISALVLGFLILSPNSVQWVAEFIGKLFG